MYEVPKLREVVDFKIITLTKYTKMYNVRLKQRGKRLCISQKTALEYQLRQKGRRKVPYP